MPNNEERIKEIEEQMKDLEFWENKARARELTAELNKLKSGLGKEGSEGHGDLPAVITIFSGAGGDDAEDFSAMLFQMYSKYSAKKGWPVFLIHKNDNDHGGFRNITFEVSGKGAYGELKNESGVHRLVRISPFSSKKLRHTSFSMVEVIPKFKKGTGISGFEIPDSELRVEFMCAGGPGGQNVNKRETAVRVIHIPTNISVHSAEERSQADNRARAIDILRGKLYKYIEEERIKKEEGMYVSKITSAEWGSQIRSYVLHPYKMVKDHRTGVTTSDIDGVLNGELDEFIGAEKGKDSKELKVRKEEGSSDDK